MTNSIHDPDSVRRVVIEKDMRHGLKRLHDKEDRKHQIHAGKQRIPDVDLFAYIDTFTKYQTLATIICPALNSKLKGIRHVPHIEKQ